ncbi:hypothetical protein [Sulfurimonas sp. HSL3-2]|jgi:hypothetical protein|uniref:hypothetical protein n=1 Tax=Hydrocurvibacter mobilis TaxID=3131936 RepID=UPI0031F8B3E4
MVSYAVIGGVLLNIGAYLTYKGKIYESVIAFLLADMCWVIMAYEKDDYLGMFFIIVGVTFGVLAFLKMQTGKMRKNLNRNEDDI